MSSANSFHRLIARVHHIISRSRPSGLKLSCILFSQLRSDDRSHHAGDQRACKCAYVRRRRPSSAPASRGSIRSCGCDAPAKGGRAGGARADGCHGPARGQAWRRALCAECDGAAGRSAPAATDLLPASPPLAGCSSQPDQRATVRVTRLIQITGYGERASEGTRRARRAPPERQCGW